MNIRNRLFTYPVLCGDTDDYKETTGFIIDPARKDEPHELIFDYEYEIKCDALEKLVRQGFAEYVLHVECSATAFRKALKSATPNISYRLEKSLVNGEISLVALIVAKKEIIDYQSTDLNEDYEGETIVFPKGAILAYQNLPSIYVKKKTEDLKNKDSFFVVIKDTGLDPDEIKPLSFNLYAEKIQITVDQKTYDAYTKFKGSVQPLAMSLIVLPAVVYMISVIREEGTAAYEKYDWYHQISKYYNEQGRDFYDAVMSENPVELAQAMLQNPIGKAYRNLSELEN